MNIKFRNALSLLLTLLRRHKLQPLSLHVHIWVFKLCSNQAHHTFQKIFWPFGESVCRTVSTCTYESWELLKTKWNSVLMSSNNPYSLAAADYDPSSINDVQYPNGNAVSLTDRTYPNVFQFLPPCT